MKLPVELTVSILLLCLGIFVFVSYNGTAVQTSSAREFHEKMIDQIESSGFESEIINRCKEAANEKGYELVVTNDGFYESKPKYKVVLKYSLKIPVLGIINEQNLEGYAL